MYARIYKHCSKFFRYIIMTIIIVPACCPMRLPRDHEDVLTAAVLFLDRPARLHNNIFFLRHSTQHIQRLCMHTAYVIFARVYKYYLRGLMLSRDLTYTVRTI